MPITCLVGPPRSGKSYEAINTFLVPACSRKVNGVPHPRRVWCNIPVSRTNLAKIAACPVDKLQVFPVSEEQLRDPLNFPTEVKGKYVPGNLFMPGDMLIIDEIDAVYDPSEKLDTRIRLFFKLHGHFADPEFNQTMDVVLIGQTLQQFHRGFKMLGESYYKVFPRRFMNRNKEHRLSIFGSYTMRQHEMTIPKPITVKHDVRIYKAYKSFSHGSANVKTADKRAIAIKWYHYVMLVIGILAPIVCLTYAYKAVTSLSSGAAVPTATTPASSVASAQSSAGALFNGKSTARDDGPRLVDGGHVYSLDDSFGYVDAPASAESKLGPRNGVYAGYVTADGSSGPGPQP